jgi:hypothetical protein
MQRGKGETRTNITAISLLDELFIDDKLILQLRTSVSPLNRLILYKRINNNYSILTTPQTETSTISQLITALSVIFIIPNQLNAFINVEHMSVDMHGTCRYM